MDWFEQLIKAKQNGRQYALNAIIAGEARQESPLSGEWAGAPTPKDVVEMSTSPLPDGEVTEDGRTAGPSTFDGAADWEVTELCDAWEDGYNSVAWPGEDGSPAPDAEWGFMPGGFQPGGFQPGDEVEILMGGEWVGPYTVTEGEGRSPQHLVLRGKNVFEHYNDAPHNIRRAS